MPTIYVAASKELGKWGADVGVSKHVYKLGVTEGSAEEAVAALNQASYAGQSDWKLVKKEEVDSLSEEAAVDRLQRKEKLLDPNYYPRLRGTSGIFRVKPVNVENHILVGQALAGREPKLDKLKPADMAQYLITIARE
ncbi:MAG: hypothetical protein K0S81_1661 [Rhodospirillales bacterium]|jgi:hypothetical protein|nr:hypothetical protein [Rhodospirillales bacterium]